MSQETMQCLLLHHFILYVIFVKTLTGKHVALDASPNDEIGEFKAKIHDNEGIQLKLQRVVFPCASMTATQSTILPCRMDR